VRRCGVSGKSSSIAGALAAEDEALAAGGGRRNLRSSVSTISPRGSPLPRNFLPCAAWRGQRAGRALAAPPRTARRRGWSGAGPASAAFSAGLSSGFAPLPSASAAAVATDVIRDGTAIRTAGLARYASVPMVSTSHG